MNAFPKTKKLPFENLEDRVQPGYGIFFYLFTYGNLGRVNDIIVSKNRKRNSAKNNLWLEKGKRTVIPYTFRSGFNYEGQVKQAIKSMNDHLNCGYDVWVPRTNEPHGVEFIEDGG